MNDNYETSMAYENFICNCMNCPTGDKFGAQNQFMKNLMDFEQGTLVKISKKETDWLSKLKYWMTAAVKAAKKNSNYKSIHKELNSYLPKIEAATKSADLLKICNDGNNLFHDFKTGIS